MNYREFNILNTLIIAEPGKVLPPLYSPRDEIAHPHKLYKLINKYRWDGVYEHNNRHFNYISIPWVRSYSKKIESSNFYVLSNYTVMFNTINKDTNWKQWLQFWGLKPFLITTPVFKSRGSRYISKYSYPESICEIGFADELNKLIESRSYTIANGYILFLALYRIGYIKENIVVETLIKSYNINYYQEIHYEWQDLYYGHDIPHIADFPWYYGTAELSENVLNLLMPRTLGYNFILSINNYYITPTFQSTMFPKMNPILWDKWDNSGDKWITDYTKPDCRIIPDIPGFIQSIITNKKSWNWWNLNKIEYIRRLNNHYNEIFVYIFYKLKNSTKYSEKNKLKHIYRDILNKTEPDRIKDFLTKYLLKIRIHDLLNNRYSYYEVFRIPSQFIIDSLKIHGERLQIFDDTIYKSLVTPVNLLIANDNIRWSSINLYKFIKLDNRVSSVIDKRILYRLCCIHKYFSDSRYIIGTLLIDYLKRNREFLIF